MKAELEKLTDEELLVLFEEEIWQRAHFCPENVCVLNELHEAVLERMKVSEPKPCHCGQPVDESLTSAGFNLCKDCQMDA